MKYKFKESKIQNNFCLYDIESTSRDPYKTQPIELAAIIIDVNTLEIKENGEFSTLIKPDDWDEIEQEALNKNKITREMLLDDKVPCQKMAIEQFYNFCKQFTRSDKIWDQLIPVGYNICNFDNIIMDRMCVKHGIIDLKKNEPKLFHPFHFYDISLFIRIFFENTDDLTSYSLDNICDFFGISNIGSHRALNDVRRSYLIFRRFMQFFRQLAPKKIPQFRNCFGEHK